MLAPLPIISRALLVAKMSVWGHLGLYLGLLVEARILSRLAL